jgi:hypothetical protein
MKRDPRPVFQQVKSGLKIAGIMVVVLASVMVCLSLLPVYRIEAWAWHLRHGNSIQVGQFQVPVPHEWKVERFDSGDVLLINTKGGKSYWATITLSKEVQRNVSVADLEKFQRRTLESIGMHITDVRNLRINGASGFCLDGETTMAALQIRNISCRVGTNFALDYVGSSLKAPAFYSILDGVSVAQGAIH